jgi:NAD(P)H-dependent FMN reductase
MFTIISSTNRTGAYTRMIAGIYANILQEKGHIPNILDLKNLPRDFVFSALFENEGGNPEFNEIQKLVDATKKFIFIVPEYNGSFPGVLKAFIDGLRYPDSFRNKFAALVGLSSGHMGGALALSHLTDVLHYLGMHVLPIKPRLPRITRILEDGVFSEPIYMQLLNDQAQQLIDLNCR